MNSLAATLHFPPPPLTENGVHLWHVQRDSPVWQGIDLGRYLSSDELERAARFRFQQDARRFSTTRGLLRVVLAAYLDVAPEALSFVYGERGKPALAEKYASGIQFNVSHSHERAMFGISKRAIGVDLEWARPDAKVDGIARRFLSETERAAFIDLPPSEKHRAFFDCWTRKEAFIKARGDGLFAQLKEFDVSFRPGERAQLLATRPDPSEATQWELSAVDIDPEYAGAVVVQASQAQTAYWTSDLLGSK